MSRIILRDVSGFPILTQAEIFGNLAIHPAVKPDEGFTISHVVTGLAIARNLDEGAARRVASALCAQFDWSFQTRRDAQPIKAQVRAMVATLIATK